MDGADVSAADLAVAVAVAVVLGVVVARGRLVILTGLKSIASPITPCTDGEGGESWGPAGARTGLSRTVKKKLEPWPEVLSAHVSPPISCARCRQMLKPKPVPSGGGGEGEREGECVGVFVCIRPWSSPFQRIWGGGGVECVGGVCECFLAHRTSQK